MRVKYELAYISNFRVLAIMLSCKVLLDVATEAPLRTTGPEPMDEVGTLDSIGDWSPRVGA